MTIEFIIAGLLIINQFFVEPSNDLDFPTSFDRTQIIQSSNRSCNRLIDNPRLKGLEPRNLIKQFGTVEDQIFTESDLSPSIRRVFKDFDFNKFFKFLHYTCGSYEQAKASFDDPVLFESPLFDVEKVNQEYKNILSMVGDTKSFRYGELPSIKPVFDGEGQQIGESFQREGRREWVSIQDVPPSLIQVILAAEDQHFFTHRGIDENGLLRAFVKSFAGERLEGGSTITQQVAKNLLVGSDQNLQRKFVEMATAFYLERDLGKERILELYINLVFMGHNSWGFKLAAKTYFDKELRELTLSEQATLAGLIKWPGRHNPISSPQVAKTRRDQVLDSLLSIDSRKLTDVKITPEKIEEARKQPIKTVRTPAQFNDDELQYFLSSARTEMVSPLVRLRDYIEVTMNTKLQKIATQALREGLEEYEKKWGRDGFRGPVTNLVDLEKEKSQVEEKNEKKPSLGFLRRSPNGKDSNPVAESEGGDAPTEASAETEEEQTSGWLNELKSFRPPSDSLGWSVAAVLNKELDLSFQDGSRGKLKDAASWAQKLKIGDVVYVKKNQGELFEIAQLPEVEGSVVIMNPHNGEVLAVSGGYVWNNQNQYNRATMAMRQPGSLVKPFTYMAALQDGQQPNELIIDSPIELVSYGKKWRPQNYDRTLTYDYLTMRYGLEHSKNILTVRLMASLGLSRVLDIMQDFGVYEKPLQEYSVVLGSQETTLLSIVNAYAQIANGGKKITPSFVRHSDGHSRNIDLESVDKTTLAQIRYMLQGVVQRGTAVRLRKYGQFVAGKTGTSNDSRDVWFVGFTPDLVIGVYVGYDRPRSLSGRRLQATGSSVALPIFTKILEESLKLQPRNLLEYRFQEIPGANIEYRTISVMNRHESLKNSEPTIDEIFRRGFYSPNQVLTTNREMLNIRDVDREDPSVPIFPDISSEQELTTPARPIQSPNRHSSQSLDSVPSSGQIGSSQVPRAGESRSVIIHPQNRQVEVEQESSSDALWDWVIELQNEKSRRN